MSVLHSHGLRSIADGCIACVGEFALLNKHTLTGFIHVDLKSVVIGFVLVKVFVTKGETSFYLPYKEFLTRQNMLGYIVTW